METQREQNMQAKYTMHGIFLSFHFFRDPLNVCNVLRIRTMHAEQVQCINRICTLDLNCCMRMTEKLTIYAIR